MDEIELNTRLGIDSCSELFVAPGGAELHTTFAIRYPTFVKRADGGLRNYDGQSPAAMEHPMLGSIIAEVLVPELGRLVGLR